MTMYPFPAQLGRHGRLLGASAQGQWYWECITEMGSSRAESCTLATGGDGCCGRNLHVLPLVYSAFIFCADSLMMLFSESAERFGFRCPGKSLLSVPHWQCRFHRPYLWAWIMTAGSARLSRVSFHLFCHLHVTSTRFSFLKPFTLPAMSAWRAPYFFWSSHIAFQPLCLLCLRSVLRTLSPTCQL